MSTYHANLWNHDYRRDRVAWCCDTIRTQFPRVRSLVVRGVSGVSLGAIVADQLSLGLLVVRKAEEDSHGESIQGDLTALATPYLLLDDFGVCGDTLTGDSEGRGAVGGPRGRRAPVPTPQGTCLTCDTFHKHGKGLPFSPPAVVSLRPECVY